MDFTPPRFVLLFSLNTKRSYVLFIQSLGLFAVPCREKKTLYPCVFSFLVSPLLVASLLCPLFRGGKAKPIQKRKAGKSFGF